jgi:3'-phosphoadenosine 5'-phosphosulfate sulfotransferase (PAPS reductase)/FAD synthetase
VRILSLGAGVIAKIIVPVSGGKDSQACLSLAIEEVGKANVVAVFNDTGWEHPLTYQHLDTLAEYHNITINKTVGGKKGKTLPELITEMGRFPFGRGRFCTMYLKQYALRDWYKDYLFDGETNYEVWFGMRTDESGQRARKYSHIVSSELYDLNDLFPQRYNKKLRTTMKARLPIVDWPTQEVFTFLNDRGEPINPLYSEGTNDRVGCYPCMLAGKKVQAKMLSTPFGQQRLEEIRVLEKKIGKKYEMHDTDQGSCELCRG